MGTSENVSEWGTAQNKFRAIGSDHFESEIRMASGDDIKGEGSTGASNIVFKPR
jgi:hypothetical protein